MYNQLNQGSAYLRMRKQRQRSTNMNIIEGFANPPGPGPYSCCSSDCTPRYGYCPPTFDDLQYEKDDDPSQRQAQMNKFNQLLSQYGSTYKNYMEDVVNYVANPPTGLLGQNVTVQQLSGPAPWGPGNEPSPPACPPDTCITYNGSKYRTLTGLNPLAVGSACEDGNTDSIPVGWIVAPADAESKKVVGMYNWGTMVVILADGRTYNTKDYGIDVWPGQLPGQLSVCCNENGVNTDGVPWYTMAAGSSTPIVKSGCDMALLLKKPPPAGGPGGGGPGHGKPPPNYGLHACEKGLDIMSGDSTMNVVSAAACQQTCAVKTGCTWWSYYPNTVTEAQILAADGYAGGQPGQCFRSNAAVSPVFKSDSPVSMGGAVNCEGAGAF